MAKACALLDDKNKLLSRIKHYVARSNHYHFNNFGTLCNKEGGQVFDFIDCKKIFNIKLFEIDNRNYILNDLSEIIKKIN